MTRDATMSIYWKIGLVAIVVGVVVVLISGLVKRLMHLDTLRDAEGGELAGRAELAENQGAGMFPRDETKPGTETL